MVQIEQTLIQHFGPVHISLVRLQYPKLRLHVGTVAIKSTIVVQDLDLLLDSELTMWQYIGKPTGLCNHHLRRRKKVQVYMAPLPPVDWRLLSFRVDDYRS